MKADETDRLIDDLLEGDISEADFIRLEAEMIVSEEARKAYYDRQKLDTALRLDAESRVGTDTSDATSAANRSGRSFQFDWLMACGLAALLLVVGTIGWKIGEASDNGQTQTEEPVATGFGVLAGESEAAWEAGSHPGKGDLIPEGPLKLKSGIAKLEFFSGAVVLIQGEAEFEVVSPNELVVTKGRLRARVPKLAKEFRIGTPMGFVFDAAADFVMEVIDEEANLHVLEGKIAWRTESRSARLLTNGESIRWDGASNSEVPGFAFDAAQLSRLGAFEQELNERQAERLTQWEQFSHRIREDPRLIAYFPMDQEGAWNRHLADESGSGIHGTIVRANRAMDRWGRPYAGLDFSPMGSRVRLAVPGEHESVTLMCWVKIDSLDRWYNSLFLTDGHELHEPHWQLMNDGRMFFSIKARDEKGKRDKHITFSPPIWAPAQSGQWMHLATVYDGKAFTTTHYVNGEAVSIDPIPVEFRPEKVVIGPASIGNWSEPRYRKDAEFAVRNLNGSIDEFAIYGVPLGAAEIREIYEIGRP